jgi:hypothetical protein
MAWEGRLAPDDLVWKAGAPSWVPVREVVHVERSVLAAPPYPWMAAAAGITWIVFGGLILINLLVLILFVYRLAAGGNPGGAAVGGGCGGLLLGLFGGAFLHVGLQTLNGTARDTLGNGVGSFVIGLLNLGASFLQAAAGQFIQAAIAFVCGLGLIAAGGLALVGREEYKAWRRAKKGSPHPQGW